MPNDVLNPNIGPVAPKPQVGAKDGARESAGSGPAFDKILQGKIAAEKGEGLAGETQAPNALKFSAHALSRIRDRAINMGGDMMGRLEKAVDSAAAKGAKESLVLTGDAAFIVSVKNKTVITVMGRDQMNGNVFTNIDSTVLA